MYNYCSKLKTENDTLKMYRFAGGYFDAKLEPHYYVTDYQGNVTHDVTAHGYICQKTNYYPYGEPWQEPEGDNRYLFGGKERENLANLRLYDFGPRMLNSAVGRWYAPDKMSEKYYQVSPYAYCAGNPLKYIDPTGMILDYSRLSEDDHNKVLAGINLAKQSKLFQTVMTDLENDDQIIYIMLSNQDDNPGCFSIDGNGEWSISLSIDKKSGAISTDVVLEEFFHAFQDLHIDLYSNGDFNREFEAKAFRILALNEGGIPGGRLLNGMDAFFAQLADNEKLGEYIEEGVDIKNLINSESFPNEYNKSALYFINYCQTNNIGGPQYVKMTTIPPACLINVVNLTFSSPH